MNRPLTALFAALEALLVVGIGIGIPLVPLTILWAVQYGLQIDWVVFWRASADIWLLGNGADVRMTLDPATASTVGLTGAAASFLVSIAPLGFALLTVLLGVRAGRRIVETPHARVGLLAAVVTFGILSFGVTMSALYPLARPSIWQGTLLPTVVFAIGILIGTLSGRRASLIEPRRGSTARWSEEQPEHLRAVAISALRGGAGAVAIVMTASAVTVAATLLFSYAKVIALYESAHAGILGGISITLGQVALLPNLVIWAASWFVGPGFSIGTGSSISPLGTGLVPLPDVPVLGALPSGDPAFGYAGLLVPVLAGFLAGILVRPRLLPALEFVPRTRWLLTTGLGVGVVGGILLGLLAWFSAGAAGPGRLVDVGPSPWLVGLFGALEIGVAAAIGASSGVSRSPK